MATESSFLIAHPAALWLVWALPAVAAAFWLTWRWNRQALARYFSADQLSRLAGSVSPARRRAKLALLLLALLFSILALAEPKWGVEEQTVHTSGRDILVLLDVSKSMLATDVAPSRLERVKLDIQDMVGVLKGDRIGLIVFAGHPVLKCPLKIDYAFFRRALDRAGVQSVTRGGTLIGDAIRLGIDAFTDQIPNNKTMLLISDGEDQGSYPIEAARQAAERGIRIFTVGVGDRDFGSRIRVDGDFVRDEGKEVWTKLNPDELRRIAQETAGGYIPAGTRSLDLDRIYRQKISAAGGGALEETKKTFVESRYQLFLFFGVLFLAAECLMSDRVRTRRIAAMLVFLCFCAPSFGAGPDLPDVFDLYNEGRALYENGAYDSAAEYFSRASTGPSADFECDAFYNLGNANVQKAGRQKDADLPGAIQSLRLAVSAYRESLDRRPGKKDAQHNLELARRLLKQLVELQRKKEQEDRKRQDQKKDQTDTQAGQNAGDTSQGQPNPQSSPNQGPQDQGKSFNQKEAERQMKDRLKEMQDLRQQLMQAARQRGVDPEKNQEQAVGVVGGAVKDW